MTEKKDRLKLVSRNGFKPRYRFPLILLTLAALTVYSFANTFTQMPLGETAAVLTVLAGLVLIVAVFSRFFPRNDHSKWLQSIPTGSFRLLFLSWAASVVCIVTGYSSLYTEVFRRSTDSFAGALGGITSLYFSVVTFATVGYGDIYPTASLSRILVISEILIPVLLLPLILAISIFWVLNRNQSRRSEPGQKPRNPYTRVK